MLSVGSNARRGPTSILDLRPAHEMIMKRREFITVIGSAAAWPLTVRAQPSKVARIGVLYIISVDLSVATAAATTVPEIDVGIASGFVRDISVDLSVATAAATTVPEIDVGIASADFTYGRYRLGTAVATGYAIGFHSASRSECLAPLSRPRD
jgi:hypothetical protein